MTERGYRGRIAPSPTGFLHLGHAMTFWRAQQRAREAGGKLILRVEDLDRDRCRKEFADAISEDLRWFGIKWDEGPDIGGPFVPYVQSARRRFYSEALEALRVGGYVYPCKCSRKDVMQASLAPHDENEEPIYPGTCRPAAAVAGEMNRPLGAATATARATHWRFRVPDDERIDFFDERVGKQCAVAGRDFGDFIVWRRDDVAAYQLAVVVDDAAMQVSEVVRGEDLLMSTFRQLLLYRALGLRPPKFYHAPLVVDKSGKRLAKRHGALSLHALRQSGATPEEMRSLCYNRGC
ncbi:MAG TPA: tRNA glutamyl-Q(34) synthetase GluQRS [Pyrinomonadaceae bacterium]|jgi:glutamyl-queuosine tRNA(Asp) synthetase|nr:tRNA glutamyl-Q(34) synthetase GluQRS [Pyrinomonadaceae bacterium]